MTPAQQMQRILEAFLNYRKATAKPATYEHDCYALRPLREYLAAHPPAATIRELMIGYLAYIRALPTLTHPRRGQPAARGTLATWGQRAFQLCKWAVEEGYLDAMPLKAKELPKQPPPKPEPLTPEELNLVMRHIGGRGWLYERNRAILIVLLETGCRLGELIQMRAGDVAQGYADVIQKGGRPHRILFTRACLDAMHAYLNAYPRPLTPESPLWRDSSHSPLRDTGVYMMLRMLGKRAGVHLYPHRFRDTSATLRLAAGAPTEVVRRALGHASEKMIRHYVQLSDLQQRQLLEATSPTARLLQESTQKEVK